jgi:hypothetical protein
LALAGRREGRLVGVPIGLSTFCWRESQGFSEREFSAFTSSVQRALASGSLRALVAGGFAGREVAVHPSG